MNKSFLLADLDRQLKVLIGIFILVLSIGFYTGISFVHFTTGSTVGGIEENYLGNEENEDAEEMKFKKTNHEMLSILHTHLLSMSVIFFLLGILVYGCFVIQPLKTFLMVEPMISVLLTFGGIYLLWNGYLWFKYIVIFSGSLMTLSFGLSTILIFCNIAGLVKPKSE